jgi:hypothetical protein
MKEIQARSSRPTRRPARLPIPGADVRHVRLGLGLSLVQWAKMLGVHERAAQRWERLKHAGPRVSSLVRLPAGSQQFAPSPPVLLAPTTPAVHRGSPAVLLEAICHGLVVENLDRAKCHGPAPLSALGPGELIR